MKIARWTSFWVAAAAVLLAGSAPWARAAGEAAPPENAESKVILEWETFKKITGWKPGLEAEPGTFTLSWKEVEDLLGVKIEGVGEARIRIPWQEFRALLLWSIEQKKKPEAPPPPTDWMITAAEYDGRLSKDGAVFTATFQVRILREKDWKAIPLLPATVAIQETKLPDGAYLRQSCGHYELLTTATGAMEVQLKFAVAVTEQAGAYAVRFDRVPSGSGIVKLALEQKDVAVNVAGAQSVVKREEAAATTVVAALPAGAPVQVTWERAIPEAEKVPPKLYAETQTLLAVGDGILVGRQRLSYNILHTGVRVLKVRLPQGVSILEVQGNRVRDWRVAGGELTVNLGFEAIGSYDLHVTYEMPTGAVAEGLALPVLRAVDVVREKGHIGVVALANVELSTPRIQGATAIDVRELPPELLGMTGQPILLAYRYVAEQFEIQLAVKKHEDVEVLLTIIDTGVVTTMQTSDGRRITRVVYNVRNNRQQFLRLAMPAGADIWSASVSARAIRPAKDEQGRVLIPLVRSEGASSGLAAFPVEIVYVEKEEKKPAPSGTLHVDLPQASEPVTHLMVNLYLPKEGKYTKPWSSEAAIEGPLAVVKAFRRLLGAVEAPAIEAEAHAQAIVQEAQQRADTAARGAGATPIRVNLPIDGTVFRLERILVLPGDPLFMDVRYSGWDP